METVKRSGGFSSNWPTTCNDSKTGSADSLACRTTDIRYKLTHHNRKRIKINERTVRWRLNEGGGRYNRPLLKPLLTENHRINRLKRLQSYGLEPSDLHRRDNRSSELCQRNGLELTWKKISCELSSIQLKSMFGVASQVKDSVGSSVLRKT